MNDRLLREIRDRLTAIAALLCALLVVALLGVAVLGYWHFKVDALRRRTMDPVMQPTPETIEPRAPRSTSATR